MEIPIYIINYKDDVRKNKMLNRFNQIDLNVKILNPISMDDPRILKANFDKRVCHIQLQHLNCMEDFLNNTDKEYCIICEDDIYISKYLKEDLPYIIQNFDRLNLDILLLGYLINFKLVNNLVERSYSFLRYTNDLWGAQMYMVSRKYAKYILDKYTVEYANENLDKPFASDWTITKEGNRAIIYPMLGVEEGNVNTPDNGQIRYHKECCKINYDEKIYI